MNIPDWIKDAKCYAVPEEWEYLCRIVAGGLQLRIVIEAAGYKTYSWMLLEEMPNDSGDQLREAWERLRASKVHTCHEHCDCSKDDLDGLYVAVERRVECPRCHGDGYVVTDDKLFMCSQCNATGTIKRLELERAIELPYTRVLNYAKEWRTAHPDIPLSPIQPENYIKCVLKYCDYAALFFTDGTHEAVIKREDLP